MQTQLRLEKALDAAKELATDFDEAIGMLRADKLLLSLGLQQGHEPSNQEELKKVTAVLETTFNDPTDKEEKYETMALLQTLEQHGEAVGIHFIERG